MKLNQTRNLESEVRNHPRATVNHEGDIAFLLDVETKLYTMVASRMYGEKTFYESAENLDNEIIRLVQEVARNDPEFVLQLAAYTRNVLNLRTVSIVMLVEASLVKECQPFVRQYVPSIVRRADELKEILAYINSRVGDIGDGGREQRGKNGSLPMSLKKGLVDVFHRFDEYQLAKYNGGKGSATLKDVIRVVHPKPKTKKESALWGRLVSDKLKTPETWEVVISSWKDNFETKKEAWESVIPKMGYMALLRNLRNFLEEGVNIKPVLDKLTDPDEIKKSKQIPFRFFSAYREIENTNSVDAGIVLDALEEIMDIAVQNVKSIPGITFSSADNSASMTSRLSDKSSVTHEDVANLLQSILYTKSDKGIVSIFGSYFKTKTFSKRNTLSNVKSISNDEVGSGTEAHLIMKHLLNNRIKVDRIVVISDMQVYNTYGGDSFAALVREYRRRINPNVFVYMIDTTGYGTSSVPQDDPRTCLIGGWSDKFLQYISIFESDGKHVVDQIKKIESDTFK